MNWSEQSLLVTGGTESFGKKFVEIMVRDCQPRRLVIFSRDEVKQREMKASGFDHPGIQYFVGDVRDASSLERALAGVTVVIHAAAIKDIRICENSPFEAIQTNIIGCRNVVNASVGQHATRILLLSTDKAVNAVSLYGAPKLCGEKMFVQANAFGGEGESRFCCVRYGNVLGTRGSVIPIFLEQSKRGKITLTDRRMTRFCITLDAAVRFAILCIEQMQGGEIFIPKTSSFCLADLAESIGRNCQIDYVGMRPGEKVHEVLVSEDESRNALELENMYVIQPVHPWWKKDNWMQGRALPEGFRYASDLNADWFTKDQLRELVRFEESVTHRMDPVS